MGRKVKEIAVIVVIILALSLLGRVQLSKIYAGEPKEERQESIEELGKPEEPEEPGESEEPERPIDKYEIHCPVPDGRQGYYVTKPEVTILHVSQYGTTKYSFTNSEGQSFQGELVKKDQAKVIEEASFSDGTNRLSVWMEDEEGSKIEEYHWEKEFFIDTASPQIQLSASAGLDAWYKNHVMLTVAGVDGEKGSGTESIEVYAKGRLVGTGSGTKGEFLIKTPSSGGGGVPVQIVAVDKAGNKSELSRKLYIDAEPPVTEIQGVENYMITSKPVEVRYRVKEENLLKSLGVEILRETPQGDVQGVPENKWESDGETVVMSQRLSEDGIYRMKVAAADSAGYEQNSTAQIIIDKMNPVIRRVDELDRKYLKEFSWTYPLEEMIEDFTSYTYEIQLDGKLYHIGETVKTEGGHILSVKATDAAGNTSVAAAGFTIDRTPPTVVFTDAEKDGVYEEERTFKISLENQSDYIDGIWINGERQATNPRSKIYQYTVEDYRDHTVKVKASDEAGNQIEKEVDFSIVKKASVIEKLIKPIKEKFIPDKEHGSKDKSDTQTSKIMLKRSILLALAGVVMAAAGGLIYRKKRKKG